MRRAVLIGLVAIVHLVVSVVTVISSFGAGMARFDTGAPPAAGERAVAVVREIVMFPLGPLLDFVIPGRWFPGLWRYVPFAANSVLWAVTLVVLVPRVHRRLRPGMLRG